MIEKPEKVTLVQLIPNMMTIAAICAGLTAIRFGVQDSYEWAVRMILIAAVLDGLDGRIARLLRSDSKMGAELDSLADFLNFGVAPGLLLYFWALQDTRSAGWIAVLFFATCCVLRLARFNVTRKAEDDTAESAYFTGVPSPAGAMLVLLPMFISFAFDAEPILPDLLLAIYMGGVGLLMISRIPTWSFKKTRIPKVNVKYFLVGFAFVGAAVLTYAWISLVLICVTYIGVVIVAWVRKAAE
ncbi:CDP-diacylglycerol--serine O-phosphatidyltransferase [Mesobacterium sp. TK19101]|uniref:CDP-diacylglycerol--serine O-phosphatidyltransferase n=1 Tax=Mesobacterium hydrothermale TaxID=3111907 RepID=A0ABU6HEF4_9RHOB|nr:CDP-diacylglycerol--serine O-phosphatidyltransferase [Mesobacterium sp. TK19101]MEC3860837.1 CDP-diacylglycerol--serine O-phosphatidyltransferase [Mesobacterium sp. TK19101]